MCWSIQEMNYFTPGSSKETAEFKKNMICREENWKHSGMVTHIFNLQILGYCWTEWSNWHYETTGKSLVCPWVWHEL